MLEQLLLKTNYNENEYLIDVQNGYSFFLSNTYKKHFNDNYNLNHFGICVSLMYMLVCMHAIIVDNYEQLTKIDRYYALHALYNRYSIQYQFVSVNS